MSDEQQRSRWLRPGRWVPLTVLALVLAGFAGVYLAAKFGARRELEAVRNRGLPTTCLELDAWYKQVPAGENAALVFLDAASLHVTPGAKKNPNEISFKPGEPMPPELIESLGPYVASNAPALDKMNEAAELPRSRYPIDTSRGAETLLPHLAPVKQLAQLSRWAAIQRAREGQPAEAARTLKNGFALAASLEQEPTMISELVRIASLSILVQGLEQVLVETKLSDDQLSQLTDCLRKAEAHGTNGFFRTMVGERAFGLSSMELNYKKLEQYGSWGGTPGNEASIEEFLKLVLFVARRPLGLHERDKAFYLETMAAWERASQLSYSEMLKESERVYELAMEQIKAHPIRHLISGLLLPAMGNFAKKETLLVARLRCARMALAIERFRLKNNDRLPRLDEMTPAFLDSPPRDPVDDSALEYRLNNGTGYQVLAAGASELSNQGRKATNRLDISFTIVR